MTHADRIDYGSGLDQLATDIGNLRYDALTTFLTLLSEKLQRDSDADRTRGRPILSSRLEAASHSVEDAARAIALAWKFSKPHMRNDDGK